MENVKTSSAQNHCDCCGRDFPPSMLVSNVYNTSAGARVRIECPDCAADERGRIDAEYEEMYKKPLLPLTPSLMEDYEYCCHNMICEQCGMELDANMDEAEEPCDCICHTLV